MPCPSPSESAVLLSINQSNNSMDSSKQLALSQISNSQFNCKEGGFQNGNSKKRISTGKDGVIRILPPVTAAEIQAIKKERKAKNILLMAIPKEHMRRFHGMDDAKEIWEAIRTRFGGNANSKKMQKALEAHGGEVSTEDANHKFLRSLPPAWSNLAMTMRTKSDVDTLSIDDLYNNLRVFEQEIQGASKTSPSTQNVAFVSQSKSSTNKVKSGFTSTYSTYTPSTSSTNTSEKEALAGFADEVIYSLFAKQSEDWDLLHEDLEQIDDLDIEEMDINCQAVKKLEAQLVTFQKQQLSLNEKLTFQANEIYEKDEKLKKYRRIGMKAVKEKEQLQKTLDSWKDSSKNLWRLINSGMSSNSKVGLGYEIQSNNEVLSYEEEMNFSVFNCSEEDSVGKPLYSRFIKTNDFKGVPHPLSGDYTPTPQEEIDESLYVYGKKGPQEPEPSVSDDRSSEYSTCQSNDSAGSIGTSSEHSVDPESEISSVPPEVYVSTPITTNEKGVSDPPKSKEVEPSCVTHIKTLRQQIKDQETPKVNRKNWNAMMEREPREVAPKKQRVFNTGNGVTKPVWNNTDRINHANHFIPRSVILNSDLDSLYLPRPQTALVLKDHRIIHSIDRGIFDSGCSRHMTGNKDQLEDFKEFNGGSVTFEGANGSW
ncbi:hypothetical protein Tco_1351243 [Tanacetum coccineum]